MKTLITFVLLVLTRSLTAQTPPVPPQSGAPPARSDSTNQSATQPANDPGPHEYRPGIGTVIVAELTNSVGAKNAKVGERIECTVDQDLLYRGKVIIPRNAKVVGHVTEVEGATKEHPQSRLGLTFEKILLKDKKELLFQGPAIVVALAPPISRTVRTNTKVGDMPVQMERGGQASPGGGGSGSSTGSSIMNSIAANPNLMGANTASTSGAISAANRGVIGWPGLFLLKGAPGTSVIASPKGNVELGFESQVVLLVVEPAK